MKCLIFGGGGFIGSAIADLLLVKGYALRIFERPRVRPYREFKPHEDVEWIVGDFQSAHDVHDAIVGTDVVIHLISTTLPKNSNDDPVYDVQSNLVTTLRMLDIMSTCNVRKIIFISSGGTVYGTPIYSPIDELHPTEPRVSYGITKLAIEKYLLMYKCTRGIEATILRVSNPFGARQRIETSQGAVSTFLHRALNKEPIEIWGDGSVTRDYIYIGDIAEAFLKAVEYSGSRSVFNIGSGKGVSLNDLLSTIEDILNLSITRNYLPSRPFDVPTNILDSSLAQRELGWVAYTSLRDGIIRTVEQIKGGWVTPL